MHESIPGFPGPVQAVSGPRRTLEERIADLLYDELTGKDADGMNAALAPPPAVHRAATTSRDREMHEFVLRSWELGVQVHQSVPGDRWSIAQRLAAKVIALIDANRAS